MKCNDGDFPLHYINQNVLQLLIWVTIVHLYRIVEKEKKHQNILLPYNYTVHLFME